MVGNSDPRHLKIKHVIKMLIIKTYICFLSQAENSKGDCDYLPSGSVLNADKFQQKID